MSQEKLHRLNLEADRWHVGVVSPIPFDSSSVDSKRFVTIVHPGWANDPVLHENLLIELADNGFRPIGIDTRYGYSNYSELRHLGGPVFDVGRILNQKYKVGDLNPYYPANHAVDNRWEYRRAISMLRMCDFMGIEEYSAVGHSEGGRIITLAANADPEKVRQLVIVNGAGTGSSDNGVVRLVRSNITRIHELATGQVDARRVVKGAIDSTFYAATHLRRTLNEKRVIQEANLWTDIDRAVANDIGMTVMHAVDDLLISYDDSKNEAAHRPEVEFVPTKGGHHNVYDIEVRALIIKVLRE